MPVSHRSRIARRVLRARLPLLLLSGALAASGCTAGDGEGLNIAGRPLSEGGDLPLAPTLASIQANVFDPFCVVCHAGANAPQGLRLDAASSFTSLVSVRSRQDGSLLLVAPGEPDRSYLVRKLEGTASEGEQMPLGGPSLPQSTIDFVRQWITEGASPGGAAPDDRPPVVVSLTPMPGSTTADFPVEIAAGFDQAIDASTINALTFTLLGSGGDGSFDDGNEVIVDAASVALATANPRLALMDLSGVTAVEDLYRVTLRGSGPNRILGENALALDGEFAGSLPSGDGREGGDFVAEFDVQGLQASLASIQANIFTPSCATAGCHSGPPGPGLPAGMDLTSAAASFSSLVGVPSSEVPSLLRVAEDDADASYLVRKLEGTATQGARMPLGGPFLEQAAIDVIRRWIDDGAEP